MTCFIDDQQMLVRNFRSHESAAREGALLCSEGLALLEAFRGRVDEARATFRAAAEDQQPSGRLLREWALFEKRQGRLQVLRAQPERSMIPALPPPCEVDKMPLWSGQTCPAHESSVTACRRRPTCLPGRRLWTRKMSAPGLLLRCWSGDGRISRR